MQEILDREGLKIPSDGRRILAFVLDDIIISIVISLAFLEQIINAGSKDAINEVLTQGFFYIVAVKIIYQGLFTALYGASFGKMICKMKVVNIYTLDKPSALDSFVRAGIRMIGEIFFYILFLFAFANPFRRAPHDRLINTIVIDISQDLD